MQKSKVVLLRSTAKRRARPFVKQASLLAMYLLVRKKNLISQAPTADVKATAAFGARKLQIREITPCENLMYVVEQQPHAPLSTFDMGKKEWLDKGWRTWRSGAKGRFTCLGLPSIAKIFLYDGRRRRIALACIGPVGILPP